MVSFVKLQFGLKSSRFELLQLRRLYRQGFFDVRPGGRTFGVKNRPFEDGLFRAPFKEKPIELCVVLWVALCVVLCTRGALERKLDLAGAVVLGPHGFSGGESGIGLAVRRNRTFRTDRFADRSGGGRGPATWYEAELLGARFPL